jgi:glucose/arabinose dehydrogenase
MKFYDPATLNDDGTVSGLPAVAYGGQGGLGDVAFHPDYDGTTNRIIYLSWAEAGSGGTRGAAVGRGELICSTNIQCNITGLTVIWRQNPKVSGTGHYSHKLEFSPNGDYLFITSGDRQLGSPAQDLNQNLGKFIRLNLDGTIPTDNPYFTNNGVHDVRDEIWSYGHRNILGIQFDSAGRLWGLEHGPMGGDELNLIRRGLNYGWPNVSNGSNYDGSNIPDHSPTGADGYEPPAISWNPVIAPGDFIFYKGTMFPWAGQVIIAGMPIQRLVRVTISTNSSGRVVGTEVMRYQMNDRIRDIEEADDGAIWVIEDGAGGRLLRLTPRP